DNTTKTLYTFDGRETAPAAVNPYWFFNGNKTMKWLDAVVGGKSVGVPGALKALETAQAEFGKLPWNTLFDDAIETSEKGFRVSKRLAHLVEIDKHPGLRTFPTSATYFYPAGSPLKEGTIKKNKALAETLTHIAAQGTDYFYKGPVAEKIVNTVNFAPINPGKMTVEDFASYTALEKKPVCGDYRTHTVCGMAPPSSGGINVYQILKLLEGQNLGAMSPNSAEFVNVFAQASALSFADREMFVADSDFVDIPFASLINAQYLTQRAKDIDAKKAWHKAKPGHPYSPEELTLGMNMEQPNTSHFSIVDKAGNAVSITTSIEFMFGSGLMVDGFLLNNQLTDFSFNPERGGWPVANRVEAGKRPRSAMSPTMVFDEKGNLELVVGSPGGSRIIDYVAQTIIGVLDFNLNIQQAINLPRVTNRNDYTALEKGTDIEALKPALEALGHPVKIMDLNSGLHGVQIKDGKLIGGADPRREGVAVGQ
ncbi:gamma-glutamyltransferase, partial [Alteromonas sp. 14N.309.X.WAT.G.H12]|uniref:gamma-glutamyltransferase n=1 Tax=Alteromonas sp. 14N.309.X.WAT.G.H12 TaxID=3120824 RepID=UPI002FD5D840